jgi:putative ABC transport system permease protein
MSAGLTRQALRRHPWSFAGPIATLTLGTAVVSAGIGAQSSFGAADLDPAGRRALAATDAADFAAVFVLSGIYLSILIVAVTMAATIARQGRDIALLRTAGATPGRVRRAVAAQAAVVAIPAALAGVPLGTLACRVWVDSLAGHGVIPAAVGFRFGVAAWPAALGVALGAGVVGAVAAAVRPARVRPAVGLTETAVPRRTFGPVRTGLGLLLAVGGTVVAVVAAALPADEADDLGLLVVLALCVAAGLLGPALLRVAAPLARPFGRVGVLAADNVAVRARALSAALVPLVLAVGFAAIKIAAHTTAAHVHGVPDPAADVWLEYSGTAVYVAFAAVAAVNALVTIVLSRRPELAALRLAGATRGRVLGVLTCEALVVTGTALLAAAAVAAATLLPLLHSALGTYLPYLPAGWVAAFVLGVFGLVALGMVAPAAVLLRQPAIEAAGVEP